MSALFEWLQNIFIFPVALLGILIGLASLYIDAPAMRAKKLIAEERVARKTGWVYITGSILVYAVLRIFK